MAVTPGSNLGPYEIRSPLGAGGMGEVYRALDTKLQRDVAIKVLPERLASDPEALARFEREARAVAALSHPHILAIHDFGVTNGTAYAAMELLEGETLREKLEAGALPARKAAELGAQLADGLAAAHEKGIVHRDLKPENVFVTREGRVKILDFGLARQDPAVANEDESHSPTRSRYTDPGTVLGTAGYMSPEQVRGRSVDHRSDIFSFGAVLYEMVTGARAFRRESGVETMNAILKEDPLETPAIEGRVPQAFERILRHCLEKSPEERFQSARDLAFDLASVTGSTISARASVIAAPSRRVPVALAGTAALLCAFGLGYWVRGSGGKDNSAQPIARYTRLTEEPGLEQRPSLSPDGKTLVYAAGPPGRRGIYSRRVGGRNPVLLTKDCDKDNAAPAFAPDGERIAYRSECEGGGLFVMGATGESAKRVTDTGQDPAWSPDGAHLAFATEAVSHPLMRSIVSELWVVNVGTGEKRRVAKGDAVQPAWSPSGRRIAYWARKDPSGQRDLFTVAADGSDVADVTNDRATDWAPLWSPDGRTLYFASDRGGTMNLWRMPTDERTGRATGTPEPLGVPAAWTGSFSRSRDDRTLAYVAAEPRSTLRVMDFDPGRGAVAGVPRQVFARSGRLQALDWSPDGAWIALNDWGHQEEVFLLRPDGSGYRQLVGDGFKNREPRFAPDGGQLAFYSDRGGAYGLWSIRPDGSGAQPLSPPTLAGAVYGIWSPDGRRLASGDSASALFMLDLERPLAERLIETLPITDAGIVTFDLCAWSPDGTRLALAGMGSDGVYGLFTYMLSSRALTRVAPRIEWARWLQDSRRLVATYGNRLFLLDSATGAIRDLLPPGAVSPQANLLAAISRDDRRIAFVERSEEGDIWAMTPP